MNNLIRLLSLNVSIFDENNEKLALLIKVLHPDLICFQEVTRKVDKSALDSYISKETIDDAASNLPYSFYAPNWALNDFKFENFHGKKEFKFDFGGVIEYGNYVRSKYRITEGKSIFIQENFSYITDWEHMSQHPGEEPRMVQIVDLKIDKSHILRILNYHGIWSKNKQDTLRTISANQKIINFAREVTHPTIICGDFNLFPDTKSMQIVKDNFRSLVDDYHITKTRPSSNELNNAHRNVVDYIFVSNSVKVSKFEVVDSDASDHFPLLLEFTLE